MASTANRVDDVQNENGGVRTPLAGMFPATLPVVDLDVALVPLVSLHPTLSPTGVMVKQSKRKAKQCLKKYPQLSIDEIASIVLYTMEDVADREQSLYFVLNVALREQDRMKVRPWRDYIWLLLHGLRKLPPSPEMIAIRGCKKSPEDLGIDLEPHAEFQWSGFSSTAKTVDVMNTACPQRKRGVCGRSRMRRQVGGAGHDASASLTFGEARRWRRAGAVGLKARSSASRPNTFLASQSPRAARRFECGTSYWHAPVPRPSGQILARRCGGDVHFGRSARRCAWAPCPGLRLSCGLLNEPSLAMRSPTWCT